ncbi:MAG TPA: hypothetical protein VF576_10330 [Rubricoccaceae bacterium]
MTRPLALALALTTLTACGDSAASGGSAASTTPGPGECPWVSNADASAALGVPVTLTPPDANMPDSCMLTPEPTTYTGGGMINRWVGQSFESNISSYPTQVPVEGLADQAAWAVQNGTDGRLFFKEGDDLFGIQLMWNAAAAGDHRARAEALARAILAQT